MPVPNFVVEFDGKDDYVLVDVNDFAQVFFSHPPDEVLGLKTKDFVKAENLEYFLTTLNYIRSINKAGKLKIPYEMEDGFRLSGFWVVPIQSENDIDGLPVYFNIIGVPASSMSINLQQERDDAISLLTSVFDVSEVGIVVTDSKQHVIRVNDSFIRIYGWNRDELVGHDFVEFFTDDERDRARKNHEEFLRDGIRSSGEVKITRKDGTIANALYTTAALELSGGRRFQVTTVMDITLRKRMEQSLRIAKEQADTANHAKSTFLANMSHELRTPLNAIIGFSEMMMKETFGPLGNDKYTEYLGDIHLSARHLLEIINEVLDMSKIEAGRVELDEEFFDIGHLIISVLRMMDSRAFSSGLNLVNSIEDTLPAFYADPRLIRQILINLVGNAVKYSQTNGVITVSAQVTKGDELLIIVEDDGVGIPEDRIKEALEPFGQVNKPADSSTVDGTGLGLPLAKAMTELHGGTLDLKSGVGEGTKVSITFPSERLRVVGATSQDRSPLSAFDAKKVSSDS
jgi:PAS domain S-box-containing protein